MSRAGAWGLLMSRAGALLMSRGGLVGFCVGLQMSRVGLLSGASVVTLGGLLLSRSSWGASSRLSASSQGLGGGGAATFGVG
ncbi:hypothetical protein T484DRAFT_2144823 [Baffinella frigidus]|nr:hypothetical protein T484DRAFT_2144823 [Cryptophyta sp. CCMP2293]